MFFRSPWFRTAALALAVSAGTLLAGNALAPADPGSVGITYGTAFAPKRSQTVDFHLWYSGAPGGRAVIVGGNGVFYGTRAGEDAPHRGGRYPLIVMSHGAGGNAGQFGWIAAALAQAGYVVALPNHPGTTSGNASAEAAVRIWERPGDLSAVIDEITSNPAAFPFVDTSRIATIGFSAGGYTSLALSGARVDVARLQGFCDHGDHGMSDCDFLRRGGVDLHEMDLSPAGQDHRDPRISAAVIVDPGIISTITHDSLRSIDMPMLVLNLGRENDVPAGVYAGKAARLIANGTYRTIPDATHFSFLAECKPRGADILAREGEPDPLCADAGGRSRAAIHEELRREILGFLDGVRWPARPASPDTADARSDS